MVYVELWAVLMDVWSENREERFVSFPEFLAWTYEKEWQ